MTPAHRAAVNLARFVIEDDPRAAKYAAEILESPEYDEAEWLRTGEATPPTFGTEQAIRAAALYMRNGGQSGTSVRIDDETEATLTLHYSKQRRERAKP